MHKWFSSLRPHTTSIWFLGLIWFYFFLIFSNLITQNAAGDILIQQNNTWADWALHFTQGSAMAERSLILKSSPILLAAPFTYPFVVNLFSAVLIRLGLPFFAAFVVPSYLTVIAGVTTLFILYRNWFKSQNQAIAAIVLFLCNGGLGIFTIMKTGLLNAEATHLTTKGIEWISVINSMLLPQRTFGLGFFVGLIAILLLYRAQLHKNGITTKTAITVGITLGFLPIMHMHSFIALALYLASVVTTSLFIDKKKQAGRVPFSTIKPWDMLATAAGTTAIVVLYTFYPQLSGSERITWQPGWLATEHNLDWLTFWWLNWGIVPLLSLFGLLLVYREQKKLFPWLLGGLVIFAFANLISLQAYTWDNTKLFAWSSVTVSALATITLSKIWHKKGFIGKVAALLLFFFSIASGLHDAIYTLQFSKHSYLMYTAEEMAMTQWVQANTNPDSIWLTSDKHNHWLYNLTGRQPVMAYQGWLWSHKYEYEDTATNVKKMLAHPEQNQELFSEYGVNYVVVGPKKKNCFKQIRRSSNSYFKQHMLQKTTLFL